LRIIGNKTFNGNDLRKTEIQLEIFEYLSLKLIERAAALLQNEMSLGTSAENSWNNHMMQMIEAARAHTWYYVLLQFVRGVTSAPSNLKPILKVTPSCVTRNLINRPFVTCLL
jgi:hypothetical protein